MTDEDIPGWCVLIEENAGTIWAMTGWLPCASRAEAVETAYLQAKTFQPQNPFSPRGRAIYQVGEDTWLVRVPGATTAFHFRVSVARFTEALDRDGNPADA